jgi:hypothetical protein
VTLTFAALLALVPQGAGVDQKRVDDAIRRGVEYLRTANTPGVGFAKVNDSFELVLLTLVHAGVPENDSKVQELLRRMTAEPLTNTYKVVLQAMILEELHRGKHQAKIAQCAQFLVDNQCANGQWTYGEPSEFIKDVPPARDVATSTKDRQGARDFSGEREKPAVTRKITVKKMKEGPAQGDNSNSQYAALGLRACHDAGIVLPREGAVATDGLADGPPRGWCYSRKDVCAREHRPYAAMTAGAVGAVAIYDYILEQDWRRDPVVRSGLSWLAAHWSVTENAGPIEFNVAPKEELYYYLYALERAGMLLGIAKVGRHDWYAEGAAAILDAQKPDGSWHDGASRGNSTWDTCFAVLFLKKATRGLVASEDKAARKGEGK